MKSIIKIKRNFGENKKIHQESRQKSFNGWGIWNIWRNWKILPTLILSFIFCLVLEVPISFANSDEINSGEIIISEFMANPKAVSDTAGEWLEFYNASPESINLNGWLIETQNNQHLISQDFLIAPAEHLVICKNADFNENGNIPCSYQYSGITLVNTAGQIRLTNNDQIIFELDYVADMISEGKSTELTDLENITGDNYSLSENWHPSFNKLESLDFGTPGEINSSLPETPNDSESEIPEINEISEINNPTTDENSNLVSTTHSNAVTTAILITEILPNPTGVDSKDNEFIEFYNPNTYPVDLLGWKLSNKKEHEYVFENSFIINPESYNVIYRKDFSFTLYNENGSMTLSDKKDEPIDVLSFNGSAKTGQSLNKNLAGNIFWSSLISPGTKALEPQTENTELNQESQSSASFTKITQLNQFGFLENLSPVSIKGLIVSPPGIPQSHSFYLQQDDWGVLVKAPGSSQYKQGDYLEVKGILHQTQKYNYIKTTSLDDLKKIKSKSISYYDISKCFMKGTCLKKLGSAVKFTGEFVKKTATALYFVNKDSGIDSEIALFLPNNLYFDVSVLEKGDLYEIKGILEKTSSVFRILATNQDSLTLISKKSKEESKKIGLQSKLQTIYPKTEKGARSFFPSLLKKPTSLANKITIAENLSESLGSQEEGKNENVIFSLRKKSHNYLIIIMKTLASMA
ncbi:MAG: lamin tail domain-containing protein [Patescibacteria group bacterium]|nr:lamin tail domain-containing protein [Patescibacteria group bacterium]